MNAVLTLIEAAKAAVARWEEGLSEPRIASMQALRAAIPAAEAELASLGESEDLGMMVRVALPFARDYALRNPKHKFNGRVQDPCGVHEWLEKYDQMTAPPSEPEEKL